MRRAIARGRMVPQSLSTDPRIGQLSLKAALLYDRLWINADDQGRLSGNANEIKYATCPNVDQIAKSEIPELLKEMEEAGLIKLYPTSRQRAIQMLDWWEEQRLQWAYPSRYPPPEGWQDRLRYHPTPTEIITENWPATKTPKSLSPDSELLPSKLPKELPSKLESPSHLAEEIRAELLPLPYSKSKILEHERIKESLANLGVSKGYLAEEEAEVDLCWKTQSGEVIAAFEVETLNPKVKSLAKLHQLKARHKFIILRTNALPYQEDGELIFIGLNRTRRKPKERQGSEERETEIEKEKEKEEEEGRLPSTLGSRSPPSPADLCTDIHKILDKLLESFRIEFGRVPAEHPEKIYPREPTARERAQIRDLAAELVRAGGLPLGYIREAFREASGQTEKTKHGVSYVRAILLDWLGVERIRAP